MSGQWGGVWGSGEGDRKREREIEDLFLGHCVPLAWSVAPPQPPHPRGRREQGGRGGVSDYSGWVMMMMID